MSSEKALPSVAVPRRFCVLLSASALLVVEGQRTTECCYSRWYPSRIVAVVR